MRKRWAGDVYAGRRHGPTRLAGWTETVVATGKVWTDGQGKKAAWTADRESRVEGVSR